MKDEVKILILEDELTNFLLLDCLINPFGKTIQAINGVEGLEILKKEKVSLIISDIKMPVMDGLEFIEKAKKLNFQTPTIVCSALSEIDDRKKAMNMGADGYITKPVSYTDLLRAIAPYMDEIKNNVYLCNLLEYSKENLSIQNRSLFYLNKKSISVDTRFHEMNIIFIKLKSTFTELKNSIQDKYQGIYREVYYEFLKTENLLDKIYPDRTKTVHN